MQVHMEISFLKVLLTNISSFLNLSSSETLDLDPFNKYYKRAEEIFQVVKPVLDSVVNSEMVLDEALKKAFEELAQYADESNELFRNWKALSSKVYFVLQIESSISKLRSSVLDICPLLKSSEKQLLDELGSTSLELCLHKIKVMEDEQISPTINAALRDLRDGVGPSSEILVKIGEFSGLRSNQEILIEAVALEKIKENAEQAENNTEVEFMDQLISLVTRMHDRLLLIKQTQTNSSIPILADFFCPLSLEVMTDPVIVASGQTYERAFIKKWIDLGLIVCPKTRQPLTHTTLIPNYTVKALIANWCETNNVKLPDPMKSISLSQLSPLLVHKDSVVIAESNVFSSPRSKRPMSTELDQSSASTGKPSFSTSRINRGGGSPLHSPFLSQGSLSGVAGNEHGLGNERISVNGSEERYNNNSEATLMDTLAGSSVSALARKESEDGTESGQFSQNHNRSTSVSSTHSNEDFSREANNEANDNPEVSAHATPYSSDASGELRSHPPGVAPSSAPQRDSPDFSPRFMEQRRRSQSIWRRPSERLIPRIISSSTMETRPDLSGVETQVKKLVEDLKGLSVDEQREATYELRLLAKHNMDNRIVIANCGAIRLLVDLLNSSDQKIQENAVTALLNLSINDNNKSVIATAGAIEPLIHVLDTGNPEAKENAAATLFSLSVIEENKIKIGRSGAIEPLVNLLGNGTPRGKKDAATALFNLSIHHENKGRIVQAGAVRHLVELMDPAVGMVDKAVAVLANLSTVPEGRTAIGQEGGIPLLVEVVELGSARGKENAAAALLQLCTNSGRFCNMVLQEGAVPPLVSLSQSGTPRAKEKAQGLLSYFRNQRHGNAGRG